MHSQRISLQSIMNSWMGDDIYIRVQGYKLVLIDNRPVKSRRSDRPGSHGVGLFSRLSRPQINGNYNQQKQNIARPNFSQIDQQFIVRPKSKSSKKQSAYKTSLADLSQIYSHSRKIINLKSDSKKRHSQTYNQKQPKYSSNRYKYDSETKSNHQRENMEKNYQSNKYIRIPLGEYSSNVQQNQHEANKNRRTEQKVQYINYNNQNYNRVGSNKRIETFRIQQEEMQQIMESINGIKLPANDTLCPDYQKANVGFEKMKAEIISKIIQSGQVSQLQEILVQIRKAADDIIARHYVAPPKLQKNGIFSFKDIQNDHNPIVLQPSMKKIEQEEEDKVNYIKLPQFQEEGASISSISSNNGIKNNDSKDQDFCKIDNVFINQGQNNFVDNSLKSSKKLGPQKPLQIKKQQHKDGYINIKTNYSIKNQQSVPQQSFQVQNTIRFSKAYEPSKYQQPAPIIKQAQIQNKNESLSKDKAQIKMQIKPKINIEIKPQNSQDVKAALSKKQQQFKQIVNQGGNSYQLQKISASPIKIISNLQQAQKFDPQIVKFTELKANYIQTRVYAPQIINVPSPLRFRRKQQVVKHLVAAQIVERESNSIQF